MVSLAKQREIQRERQNQDKELRAECNSRMINTGAQKEAKKQGSKEKEANRETGSLGCRLTRDTGEKPRDLRGRKYIIAQETIPDSWRKEAAIG